MKKAIISEMHGWVGKVVQELLFPQDYGVRDLSIYIDPMVSTRA
jgi:hypothetical protein